LQRRATIDPLSISCPSRGGSTSPEKHLDASLSVSGVMSAPLTLKESPAGAGLVPSNKGYVGIVKPPPVLISRRECPNWGVWTRFPTDSHGTLRYVASFPNIVPCRGSAPWRHLPKNFASSRRNVYAGPTRPDRNGTAKYCGKWPRPGCKRPCSLNVAWH
jgi:hypothetical protein